MSEFVIAGIFLHEMVEIEIGVMILFLPFFSLSQYLSTCIVDWIKLYVCVESSRLVW